MIVLLLILIPLIGGFVSFFLKGNNVARIWALFTSLAALVVSVIGLNTKAVSNLSFSASWMGNLGSSFTIQLDGK